MLEVCAFFCGGMGDLMGWWVGGLWRCVYMCFLMNVMNYLSFEMMLDDFGDSDESFGEKFEREDVYVL